MRSRKGKYVGSVKSWNNYQADKGIRVPVEIVWSFDPETNTHNFTGEYDGVELSVFQDTKTGRFYINCKDGETSELARLPADCDSLDKSLASISEAVVSAAFSNKSGNLIWIALGNLLGRFR